MNKHPVKFTGAGPGAPDLITVRGMRALQEADLIVYAGSLVPDAVLSWAGDGARLESSAHMDLGQITALVAQAYSEGEKVVRLHSGDPSLYGAIAEQIRLLREKQVPFEIIPGVTAAFAAAAELEIEYTLPQISQSLILTRMQGRTPVPERENLASLAAHGASMAIYLSSGMAGQLEEVLSENYGEESPVAVVYRASHPDGKILWTEAKNLGRCMKEAGITRQALVIAGPSLQAQKKGQFCASKLYDKTFTHGCRQGNE